MLAIVGESASGKSSVVKYLADNLRFKNIITCTTRKPREDEINDVDYHFMAEHDFILMKENGRFFAETATYNRWHYGSAQKDYENAKYKTVILTPHGIRQVRKNGIDIYTVYIDIPRRDRLIKILQRGGDIDEGYRRNLSDVGQFDGIKDEVDLVIENDGYKKSIEDIACTIGYTYLSSISNK